MADDDSARAKGKLPFNVFSDAVFGGRLSSLVHGTFDLLSRLGPGPPKSDPHLSALRAHAEESVYLEREMRLSLLIESVSEYALFMLDPHGFVSTWNAGAQRIKGYRASEIIGHHFSQFYEPSEVRAGRCEAALALATRDGRSKDEGWRIRKDGTRFWASVVLTAMRTTEGELVGFAKVTRDMTERREAEEERLRLAHAEEAIRLRDQFVAIASHELRTPLTALQLQLQGLEERLASMDKTTARKVERALRSTARMANLVESLLDASQLVTGIFTLVKSSFDLREITCALLEDLRGPASKSDCELQLVADAPLPGCWDRVRLEQVLTNLIANAIKFGAGKPITVQLSASGDAVRIDVRDQGVGVSECDRERIFGRFERSASLRNHGGLGLGLYVAREIVAAHGGSITARNNPEGGACFTVYLPRARASDERTPVSEPELRVGPHGE
jgi:PAS domain S-box-containing protein